MNEVKTVVFVRHGETEWNAEQRWQGHTDIPLNRAGLEQARQLGEMLKHLGLEKVVSSDLMRARQTAGSIAGACQVPTLFTSCLREVDVGRAEGLSRQEVIEQFGETALQRWGSIAPEDLDFAFSEGETKKGALRRARDFIEQFLADSPYRTIALVSHGMLLRTLVHSLFTELSEPVKIFNCHYFVLNYQVDSKDWALPEKSPLFQGLCHAPEAERELITAT